MANDLGSAFLDGLAVGTHHKATKALHKGTGFLELAAHTLGLGIGAGNGTGVIIAQAAIANFGNHIDGRNQAE